MKLTKEHILLEIRRTAAANGGTPLGWRRFAKETGIREADWKGKLWVWWNEAVTEAGLSPNDKREAYDDDWLLGKLALFIRELGQYPVTPQFRMKSRGNPDFPDQKTFSKFGTKQETARRVVEFCKARPGFEDVVNLCLATAAETPNDDPDAAAPSDVGYVYLMKSGKRYKIGYTETLEKRFAGLSAQVPHELIQIHAIRTDDPSGIEAYWHRRFKDKQRHNEWFELSAEDVAAFKKRKFM